MKGFYVPTISFFTVCILFEDLYFYVIKVGCFIGLLQVISLLTDYV